MSYADNLLLLHAVAVMLIALGFIGFLFVLAALCDLIRRDDPDQ